LATCLPSLRAQSSVLTAATPPKTVGTHRGNLVGKVFVRLSEGYHVNSNTPNDEYLVPLRLTWNAAPLEVIEVSYPKPEEQSYAFSDKPVSVFSGEFEIATRFKVPASSQRGPAVLTGKLRYQACNQSACLPPKSVEVRLPVHIQ
jgi:hypothetical protein